LARLTNDGEDREPRALLPSVMKNESNRPPNECFA
jgi:hypothetical protein